MHKLAKLLETSLIKSLRFNFHYFGWGRCGFPFLLQETMC